MSVPRRASAVPPPRLLGALWLLVLPIAPRCPAGAAAAPGPPQALSAAITVEPAEIRVGDPARLTVVVDHPADCRPTLPAIGRGKEVVAADLARDTAPGGGAAGAGRKRTTFRSTITSFAVGRHAVGGGPIACEGPAGTLEAAFPAAAIVTRTMLPSGDAPMRKARGLVRWPEIRRGWLGPAAGALALALAAALLALGWRNSRRRAGPAPPPAPALQPHEKALRAIAALRDGPAPAPDAVEPSYRRLSSIVRTYLEERFGLPAAGRTTEEFVLAAAAVASLPSTHRALARALLEQCDLVKFARHHPPAAELAGACDAAERLVRETCAVPAS